MCAMARRRSHWKMCAFCILSGTGLDVKIHEIWYDNMGNLQNVPQSYRRFFMEEVDRSLWGPQ